VLKRPCFSYRFWRWVCRVILRLGFGLRTHNAERVPREGGYLLVSNHASNLDPPILGCMLEREVHYLAKAEMFENRLLARVFRSINAHPIRRGGVDRQAMKECGELIRNGALLTIFPEGTRTHDGEMQAPKPGVAMIAVQARARCLPAYIAGSYRAWPRHRTFPRPTRLDVYYGAPFDLPERPEGMDRKDYYQLCADEMIRQISALKPEEL